MGYKYYKYLSSFIEAGYKLLLVNVKKNCWSQMFHTGTGFYVLFLFKNYHWLMFYVFTEKKKAYCWSQMFHTGIGFYMLFLFKT